jgi:hypothetical protein
MQQDIKDLISNNIYLKSFLLKFENKKIIIDHLSITLHDFISNQNEHNVFYYGNFRFLEKFTFQDQTFNNFSTVSTSTIISSAQTSRFNASENETILIQILKITII